VFKTKIKRLKESN